MESIGSRVRTERERQNISREDLAGFAGIGVSTLSDLELERSQTTTKLHRIADRLGVRVEWLETGKGIKAAAVGQSHGAGLDKARLAITTKFLADLFDDEGREFDALQHSHLIAEVYDDLSKPTPLNTVQLTKKYSKRLSGGEDERQGTAGSPGSSNTGRTGKRAKEA